MQEDLTALAEIITASIAMGQQLLPDVPSIQPLLSQLVSAREPLNRMQQLLERFKTESAAYAKMLRARDQLISES